MNYGIAWGAVVAFLVGYFIVRRRCSIKHIRGPPSSSPFIGNLLQLRLPRSYGDHEFKWLKTYGPVYRLRGCFGENRLMVSDLLACQYILKSQHFTMETSWESEVRFKRILCHRVDDCIGEIHHRLRKNFNMAFTAVAVRRYGPVFQKVAQAITHKLELSDRASIDIVPPLTVATMTAIAEAALGYSMDELGEEYVAATTEILAVSSIQTAGHILTDAIGVYLPKWLLRAAMRLPTKTFKAARKTIRLARQIGAQVVREKQDLVQQGNSSLRLRLSWLRVSNIQSNSHTRFLTLVLFAGQETTTKTIALGLWELAKDPKFQEMLRAEIHSSLGEAGHRNGTYDEMPLLNAFIKETLRFYPAEAFTERIVVHDTVIPLSESITTSTGEQMSQIPVTKGQIVIVGIASYQRLESRWGADADKFRPSRWLDGSILNPDPVGPYANLLTFLSGPHTCLGWRFAILEMQAVICELVGKFAFAVPENDSVRVCMANTLQPVLSSGERGVLLRVTRIG
ncbi:cytochrome P450 [Mycena albidolilacea]|uniref:Cytochrome P450 n=1 Tax=Mycena albidolilacea TaxID=1033008 RepID=A0AAD7EHL7_9AGAR|nr:cytochrome P450 [Mycena albidolilacea]